MTQAPTGGPAQTIHQVTSRQGVIGRDAQRVVIVTDGRPQEGGPQQAAYFVSDAEIAAGDFIVTGNKPLPIVKVGAAGAEHPPIAVYDVTGKTDDVQPPQGDPIGDALRADAVAYWTMNEASGMRIDATGRGNDLTDHGSTLGISGLVGNAAEFNGTSQYLSSASKPDLQVGSNDFTICFWVKFLSYPTQPDFYFLAKGTVGDEYYVFYETTVGVHFILFVIAGGDSSYPEIGNTLDIPINQWSFVAVGYNSNTGKMFMRINDEKDEPQIEMSVVPGQPATNDPFSIGSYGDGSLKSNCIIDEVGKWARPLSSDEYAYLYNSGAGQPLFPAP